MATIEVIVTGNDESLVDMAFASNIDEADKIRNDFIHKHSKPSSPAILLEAFVSYDKTGADREPIDFMKYWFK